MRWLIAVYAITVLLSERWQPAAATSPPDTLPTDDESCVTQKELSIARDNLIDRTEACVAQQLQTLIVLDRLEARLNNLSAALTNAADLLCQNHATSSAHNGGVSDNRLRSLEASVFSLQRKIEEKFAISADGVAVPDQKHNQQDAVLTDILRKILNTVNTLYARIFTADDDADAEDNSQKSRSASAVAKGIVRRRPTAHQPTQPASSESSRQIRFLKDSIESLGKDFSEKLDVLQNRIYGILEDVLMHAQLASGSAAGEDLQRTTGNGGQNSINDINVVLNEVRDGFKRCTRALVNAPPMLQQDLQLLGTEVSARSVPPPSGPVVNATAKPELAFYVGPPKDNCKTTAAIKVPHNCDELNQAGADCDGPYIVYDRNGKKPIKVMCDMAGGGWTILLRRGPGKGRPLSFDRNWASYKHGFGNMNEEFYVGNEYMHKLTEIPKMLRIILESFDGQKIELDYENFTVASEKENYRMRVGRYVGSHSRVGNAFRRHHGKPFSTVDRINTDPMSRRCPVEHRVGHWWHSCYSVLLTGEFATPSAANSKNGIRWSTWKTEPLKSVVMKMREMDRPHNEAP